MAEKDKPETRPAGKPADDFARELYAQMVAKWRAGEITPERCREAKRAAAIAADAWEGDE
jgi:hypothetical protein